MFVSNWMYQTLRLCAHRTTQCSVAGRNANSCVKQASFSRGPCVWDRPLLLQAGLTRSGCTCCVTTCSTFCSSSSLVRRTSAPTGCTKPSATATPSRRRKPPSDRYVHVETASRFASENTSKGVASQPGKACWVLLLAAP